MSYNTDKLRSELLRFKRPRDYFGLGFVVFAMVFSFIVFSYIDIPNSVLLRDTNIGHSPAPASAGGDRFQILRPRKTVMVSDETLNSAPLNMLEYYDVVGQYKGQTGIIYINQNLQDTPSEYDLVFKHEYGHALFEDIFNGKSSTGRTGYTKYLESVYSTMLSQKSPEIFALPLPTDLKELFNIYKKVPANVYGDTYETKNFAEFFAESYARYLLNGSETTYPISNENPYVMTIHYELPIPDGVEKCFQNLEKKYQVWSTGQ